MDWHWTALVSCSSLYFTHVRSQSFNRPLLYCLAIKWPVVRSPGVGWYLRRGETLLALPCHDWLVVTNIVPTSPLSTPVILNIRKISVNLCRGYTVTNITNNTSTYLQFCTPPLPTNQSLCIDQGNTEFHSEFHHFSIRIVRYIFLALIL